MAGEQGLRIHCPDLPDRLRHAGPSGAVRDPLHGRIRPGHHVHGPAALALQLVLGHLADPPAVPRGIPAGADSVPVSQHALPCVVLHPLDLERGFLPQIVGTVQRLLRDGRQAGAAGVFGVRVRAAAGLGVVICPET